MTTGYIVYLPSDPVNRKAAFLDRDGVINIDHGYVSRWEDFQFIPGSIKAMRVLQDLGYLLIVITNQSGIARGYFTEEDYTKLTNAYRSYLLSCDICIAGIYHCPHHPDFPMAGQNGPCECRKPLPGLILRAVHDHNISIESSIFIGDKDSDMLSAYNAGIPRRYLVDASKTESSLRTASPSCVISPSILHSVKEYIYLQ